MRAELVHYTELYLEYLNNTLDKSMKSFDEWFDQHGESL